MFGLRGGLIWALVVIVMICFGEVHSVCFDDNADLCFSNELECWATGFPDNPATLGNHFYLYKRSGTNHQCAGATPTELIWNNNASLDSFDGDLKTVAISHGFQSEHDDEYIIGVCDAYLHEFDVNIIMVDWKDAAAGVNYWQSRRDLRLVGRELGLLLKLLHDYSGLDYDDVHIVGHSLGAHLAGFAGEYLNGQLGRITGLDPAGPEFEDVRSTPGCLLEKSDAQFVDIIHSDGSAHLYGMEHSIGHLDFYVNRGDAWQPGCFLKFACSHMRAIDFFIASLKYRGDTTKGCYLPTEPCDSNLECGSHGCPMMGIMAAAGTVVEYCIDTDCEKGFIL